MLQSTLTKTAIAGLSIATAGPLLASDTPLAFRIDSSASSAQTKVAFLGFSNKKASFPKLSGTLRINPDRPQQISLSVKIDAKAVKTNDKRFKGKDFLHIEKYPSITFSGNKLQMTGARTGRISGRLTMRGITRPVTLAVNFSAAPSELRSRQAFSVTGNTTINRRNFGMTAFSGIVGNKVNISVKARLKKS